MVFEATYLVAVLTAGQMSLCCGQNGAQISKVFRPIKKSNGMFTCFLMAVERTGSECGLVRVGLHRFQIGMKNIREETLLWVRIISFIQDQYARHD